MANAKILLIDDETNLVQLVKMNLQREGGYSVVLAGNGDDGLKMVDSENPDLILLDVMMPGKNGFDVLKELRKPGAKWRPVIMLTGQGDLKDVRHGYDLEADAYITKPFETRILIKNIRTVLSLVSSRDRENEEDA